MSRSQPKLKPPPRPLFSCGIFRNCTQSVHSPTTPPSSAASFLQTPPLQSPQPPPPPATCPPPPATGPSSSSSSSSSSASHSFTQWRFPLQHHHQYPPPPSEPQLHRSLSTDSAASTSVDLTEAFHAAELQFTSGERLQALRLLDRSLASADPTHQSPPLPAGVISGVVAALREAGTARAAAKVLLALTLSESYRRAAVQAGAIAAAVEAVAGAGLTTAKERALAAMELLCTVEEGAEEVRSNAPATVALAGAVEGMSGRGRECGIGILAAIYGGEKAAEAPAEVARAVVVALQGECSARGRRKGAQLLRALKGTGRLDLTDVAEP
ncbi:hypothetical protein HPP92_023263 [Vanilla planifolia]|uniref:U-box domain-containing protein n=1 Tax=Vanilla planifolia TaxID=51239 RepID=A0A835PQ16_VANPL|nr:hypothetical protein HPP92_023263 [Vanilla planifolia]